MFIDVDIHFTPVLFCCSAYILCVQSVRNDDQFDLWWNNFVKEVKILV